MICMPCYEVLHRERRIVDLSPVRKLNMKGIKSMVVVVGHGVNQLSLDLLDWPRSIHLDLMLWEKHLC